MEKIDICLRNVTVLIRNVYILILLDLFVDTQMRDDVKLLAVRK